MNIDIHWHGLPETFLQAMEADGLDGTTRIVKDDDGVRWLEVNGQTAKSGHWRRERFFEEFYDLKLIVADLDKMRLDVAALSAIPPAIYYWAPSGLNTRVSRIINDGIAGLCRARPDRLVGLATVPLQDPEAAAVELKRAVGELGLRGVEILSHVDGRNLDEPEFFPFFETAQALDVPVYIHPMNPLGEERLQRYYFRNFIGLPTETAIAAGSLIFGGVLERLPNLKVVLSHAGGFMPYQLGRFDHAWSVRPEGKVAIDRPPSEYAHMLYYDTITHNLDALRFLVDQMGSDHVVIGTDYPFDMGYYRPVDRVEELGLPAAAQARILGDNLVKLLKL